MRLLPGVALGVGLFLIWWSTWVPDVPAPSEVATESAWTRLQDELVQAGLEQTGPGAVIGGSVIAGLAAGLLAFAVGGSVAVAICFALVAGYAPLALVRYRARRRRRALREVWPDAVDNITSAVRAGMALPEALSQLAHRGPVELRPAFAAFAEDYRATGRFTTSLDALKERLSDPVADRLIEALRLAREVGGSDLGGLLRTLSSFLREDARTRAELETRQSWTVNAARLSAAAPWIILAILATRGDAIAAYDSRAGIIVLAVGAVLCAVAYRLMMHIGRLPEERRVLR
ncbi:MAG: type II secretion system F family protein [Actinomycetia bacterium]|nr:type II secretion system F family protein [Actinomycetes bacterium]